jgi:hypothetical protein
VNTRQKVTLIFTLRIKLLLIIILIKILYKINNFRVAFFRLGLREVALFSI